MENTAPDTIWKSWEKVSFRFLFLFFLLIIFPFPIDVIPGTDTLTELIAKAWEAPINLAANIFLDLEEPIAHSITGSGDKLYDWMFYFCTLILAILFTGIWSVVDQKRVNYEKLRAWFVFIITYYLAYYMLLYGIIKLFYLQFGPPNLERLFQTFGQASPMRLMWTFMGTSKTYTVFAGFTETLAGVLLLISRTRTLGALTAIGVMFNVFMMNMSYDIPVKLFSFQLMIMGVYIAAQDWKRLYAFFISNQATTPYKRYPLVQSQRGKRILLGVQLLFIGLVLYSQIDGGIDARKRYGEHREKSALYGVYNVNTFSHNHDTLPPLLTDTVRWKRVLFDYPSFTSVILMNDHVKRYRTNIDTIAHTIILSEWSDTTNKYTFEYTQKGEELGLDGIIAEDTLNVSLEHYSLDKFGLLNRGFNWVNEVPYNRYNYD